MSEQAFEFWARIGVASVAAVLALCSNTIEGTVGGCAASAVWLATAYGVKDEP